ncbi:MAG: hypothetical protein ACRDJW_21640 [Thermomicrobiales bacterium]
MSEVPRARPPYVSQRNWWVYTERMQGKSYSEIGEALDLTHTRIRQIVTRVDRFLLEQPNRRATDGPAWAPPPDRHRCRAITRDGDRCKMRAELGDSAGLCTNHRYKLRHGHWPRAMDD